MTGIHAVIAVAAGGNGGPGTFRLALERFA